MHNRRSESYVLRDNRPPWVTPHNKFSDKKQKKKPQNQKRARRPCWMIVSPLNWPQSRVTVDGTSSRYNIEYTCLWAALLTGRRPIVLHVNSVFFCLIDSACSAESVGLTLFHSLLLAVFFVHLRRPFVFLNPSGFGR